MKYTSGDTTVLVRVLDSSLNEIFEAELPTDAEGILVGVPLGGHVVIEDLDDPNGNGTSGTIAQE